MADHSYSPSFSPLRSGYSRDHYANQKQLRSEQVRLLYDQLWQPVLASVLASLLLVAAMWPVMDSVVLVGWLVAILTISCVRLGLAYRFYRLPAIRQQQRRWLWRFSLASCVSGVIWGAAGLLLFAAEHDGEMAALTIVLAGIAAGGVTTLSSVWWVALSFVLPILLPLMVQFLRLGSPLSILLGMLVALFLGLVLVSSRRLSCIIRDNIALRVTMASREAQLLESESRYRSIFQHSPLGVLHYTQTGILSDCNEKLLDILKVSKAQLVGYNLLKPSIDGHVIAAVSDSLQRGSGYYEGTYCLPGAREGTPVRAFFNGVRGTHGDIIGGVAIIEDCTERKRAEAIIHRQAHYDPLTDLPNRRLFIERLQARLQPSRERQLPGLLMFLDMDRFKLINDTLGHAAGDDLLVQVARRLESCLAEGDMAARLSGDEFVMLASLEAPEVEMESAAEARVEEVLNVLKAPYRLESHWMDVTPSVGYTCLEAEMDDHEEALKQADIAMYQAKTQGRARFCRYQPEMRPSLPQE
ncbi:diguanylate cyclase [Halomonas sp. Bachu 37]|uniref:diguanylate cyclase domain-containing protein n=1 Tax=Halomonas kashgarensis TaxID=3084920 RepID=UPI003216AE52